MDMISNVVGKNIFGFLGNSLLLWLSWIWLLIPIFPTLPLLPWIFFMGVELVRMRIVGKRVGDFGIRTYTTRRPERSVDRWWMLLVTYGFCVGVLWALRLYLVAPPLPTP